MDQGLIVRRAGLGSVVIATEPPVLFTHNVRSLAEWRRYPNGTHRDVVASRDRESQAGGTVEMRAGQTLVPDRGAPPLRSIRSPLGSTEIYLLRKFAGVVKRNDHGRRAPVHEQIAKMFGQTTEYVQMEIFARGMPTTMAGALQVKAGSTALTVIRPLLRRSGRAVRGYGNHTPRGPLHLLDGHAALAAAPITW